VSKKKTTNVLIRETLAAVVRRLHDKERKGKGPDDALTEEDLRILEKVVRIEQHLDGKNPDKKSGPLDGYDDETIRRAVGIVKAVPDLHKQ
jgi:hypothetical protein